MKRWHITISQNGWEYSGHANIRAKELSKIDYKTVQADGVLIEFDEEIGEITSEEIK